MSLDDLIDVWRSQDAAPLNGVNETLLLLALRRDEANLQKQRRMEAVGAYLLSALLVGAMALLCILIFFNIDGLTGWDYGVPIIGVSAALYWAVALRMSRRAQARREQHFGESLRDRLARRIAQLEYHATRAFRLTSILETWLPLFLCLTVFLLVMMRINSEPYEPFDGWPIIFSGIFTCSLIWLCGVLSVREAVKRDLLPRKQRLERLLKEVDGD